MWFLFRVVSPPKVVFCSTQRNGLAHLARTTRGRLPVLPPASPRMQALKAHCPTGLFCSQLLQVSASAQPLLPPSPLEASSGVVRSASRLQARRSERLTRARENARGRLDAERARREAAEAAEAQTIRSRSRASVLGWSPPRPLALSSPSEIISGLGSRQWRWNAPMNSRSAGSLLTGSPGPPSLPPSVVSNDCEISSTSEAQTASPTAQLPRGYMSPRPPPRRVSPSLMRAMRSHRREVAVVPAFVSCKQKPADRQGSGRSSRTLPAAQRRSTTPASALAAQQWLSSTMQTLPLSSRLSTAEGGEGDANLTIQVARI